MLLMLLERPGELVSRQDLCASLWSNETFVEFDNSLYVAAAKLREALGDDPAAPRFVKTISRQGYQFVAEVVAVVAEPAPRQDREQPDETDGARSELESGSTHGIASEINALPVPAAIPAGEAGRSRSLSVLKMVAAGLAAAALCGIFLYRFLDRPLASPSDEIMLGDVRNATGDASLDDVFSSALRFKLQESPYLNLVDDQQFRRQSLIDSSSHTLSTASVKDELEACTRFGAQLFLAGQLVTRNSGYRVEINAWRCQDGRLLATRSADAASQSEIMPAFESAALGMRRRLGESENSLQRFNAPLIQATTSSLAALKAFTKGETDYLQGNELDAATNYKLAVDLDPKFAMAYARLGSMYTHAQDGTLGRQYFQKAFELRERTTDREKLYIAAHYYSDVLGDMPRGVDAYQLWESLYPRDVIPVENLGNIFDRLDEPEKALALEQKAVEMRPDGTIRYALLANAEFEAGRYKELDTLCNDPKYGQIDEVLLHYSCYLLAFEKQDTAGMQRQITWGHGRKQESVLLEFVAWTQMSSGRMAEARHTFAAARENAMRNHLIDFSAELDLDEAWQDADLGFAKEAHALALEALKLALDRPDIEAFAALALVRSGDIPDAEIAMAHVSAEAPENTVLVTGVLSAVRASEAMYRHDPKSAIRLLEQSRSMDNAGTLALAPAYYRGLAYLDDHQYDQAAREFQHVIDHRALMPESLYVKLSRLQLGHTLQLAGHREEALKEFHTLDDAWASADSDFPALRQLRELERQANR